MQSKATTVTAYLAELPADRRKELQIVQKMIKKSLPKGYKEGMQYGMIGYSVPLSRYPAGYLNQKDVPLPFVGLASQKNHLAVYLMTQADKKEKQRFEAAWKKSGKKMVDMGKSCIRFKKAEDLALDVIGEAIHRVPVEEFIKRYEAARKGR